MAWETSIEKTIQINFWHHDGNVSTETIEVLEDRGMEDALEMIENGYTSGELSGFLEEENKHIRGHWELKTKRIK